MADTSDPNTAPVSPQRTNPSVESTRRDDERARELHQHAQAMGTVMGTGLGCLGMAVIPWGRGNPGHTLGGGLRAH